MVSYPSLSAKPYIGRIKLNPEPEIEPIKLNIEKRFDFDDLKDLGREIIDSINKIHRETEECFKEMNKQYELFVLSELYKRGYDLLRLENSDCWRNVQPISENCEREQFYVDGILVLTVKKTMRFGDAGGRYMVYSDFEVED